MIFEIISPNSTIFNIIFVFYDILAYGAFSQRRGQHKKKKTSYQYEENLKEVPGLATRKLSFHSSSSIHIFMFMSS